MMPPKMDKVTVCVFHNVNLYRTHSIFCDFSNVVIVLSSKPTCFFFQKSLWYCWGNTLQARHYGMCRKWMLGRKSIFLMHNMMEVMTSMKRHKRCVYDGRGGNVDVWTSNICQFGSRGDIQLVFEFEFSNVWGKGFRRQ